MRASTIALLAAAAALLVGCGGSESAEGLRDGIYEFQLSEGYLLENGISPEQARNESGEHELTLDRGSFVDRWRTNRGMFGSCSGTYSEDGRRVTFRWTRGCTGDWAMTYSLEENVVTWSDFEPLDPSAGPEEQKVTEVFNGVPWTRTGDAPEEGVE